MTNLAQAADGSHDVITLNLFKPIDAGTDRIHPRVAALDFSRLRWKLENSGDSPWESEKAELSENEYRRFLTLKLMHPGKSLVPSKLVDEFWHQHILDTAAYRDDCQQVFGRYIDHFPYFGIYGADDKAALDLAFEKTNELYRKHFGEPQQRYIVARCADHACHVPSECACRTPEACK